MRPNSWTDAENDLMRLHYTTRGATGLLLMVKRTRKAINLQAAKLGLQFNPLWTEEHVAILREHYTSKGSAYVAKLVGRSHTAVRAKAIELGVRGNRRRPKPRNSKPAQIVVLRKSEPKPKPKAGLIGEPIINDATRITIAPPFVDRRWLADVVVPVVDSSQCRLWARTAA